MDLQMRKKALRMISYGLYVLTARADQETAASTVTWLSQSSMTPPMIMVGLEKESFSYRTVEKSRKFVIHFLGRGQKEMAQKFFKPPHLEKNKINGLDFKIGKMGAPVLLDAPAYIECEVAEIVKRGDHHVILAEVVEAVVQHDMEALSLRETGWSYGG